MILIDSFIKWVGGKKLLRKTIINEFPKHFDRYIEVFGGAGWVLFGEDKHAPIEVFNDIDSNLVNLYRCIKYHPTELQHELSYMILSREQFFDCKNQLQINGLTDIQKAARYFFIINVSFGALKRSFDTGINKDIYKTIEFFPKIQDRLKKVTIENKDFENLIKVYDRPNALFYVEPPYFQTEKYYNNFEKSNNKNFYTDKDHSRLFNILDKIKGKFILSYNDNEIIREIYKNYNIKPIIRKSNFTIATTNSYYNELIITNY